ncbi:L-2,4-diaminobutyrate decarboxylase [Streptomyces sp. YIM 130001]|uniref:pyridoxal phosphate-dependent decarboxylase family protein n=1 Tax=Streptomyces sp. YIM 130001 TaxID=2259644 RepID=UPI000E648873|nr:pyridoxal-dependent decarboxylase [Streptomyces sp. YIM 130001]RII07930.1 L-2,4-diaminobutyrate decarboxylase [Streptomyces sp. YIM 130001]
MCSDGIAPGPALRPGLEPRPEELAALLEAASSFVAGFVTSMEEAPVPEPTPLGSEELTELLAPPAEAPGEFGPLLETFGAAAARATETTGPDTFAYFPGGGLITGAVAELLSCTVNRYTGLSSMAPALVAMEQSVIRWLCGEFGLPEATAGGVITTGASTGTLSALLAARESLLGGPPHTGVIYVTEHTHLCVAKAARIAGFPLESLRTVPVDGRQRMDPEAAERLIVADRAAGRTPFLLVGTAGTTSTGAVDPLRRLAATTRAHQLWFHIDAAYGGGFQLTERGRDRLAGIELADSVVLDPHKSLFLPYGSGVLLVRDARPLRAAHRADADYLQDLDRTGRLLPDYADLGTELSRGYRGLRLWLPLQLHGVGAFRTALDEKLDLADVVHRELRTLPGIETLPPDLTVLAFRASGGDAVNQRLLEAVHAAGRARLTSTRVQGHHTLRLCVLNHRTHRTHVDAALKAVRRAAEQVLSS